MCLGKTVIISNHRVIKDLGEKQTAENVKKQNLVKQFRNIPDYSSIDRRQHVKYFTPSPAHNGHAKPGELHDIVQFIRTQ